MVFMKKCISVRFMYSASLKCFITLCSVVLICILASTCLKSFYNIPTDESNEKSEPILPVTIRIGELNAKSAPFMRTSQKFYSKGVPVKEFQINRRYMFRNEEARLIGFPIRNITISNNSQKIIYLATQYFSQWYPEHYYFFNSGKRTFTRHSCPVNNCYITNNPSDIQKSHAVLFHVRDMEVYSMPLYRAPDQIWILYGNEPPWLEITDMRRFNGVFNWTMSYRRTSDVYTSYGFIGRKHQTDSKKANKLNLDNMFQKKNNKAVWYVSNCQTDGNREGYIDRLRKIYPVDVIGGCGVEGCKPAETKKCYNQIESDYMFYIAFENAICQDYVTEKLFNPLEYYIIPVTFGGVNYSDIVPSYSIINAMDFPSPEELGHHLWKVSQNKSLYLSYFAWKDAYRSYLQPWMCDLCEKLHVPTSHRTRYDLENWWHEDASCLRWSESGFKPVQNYAFPQFSTRIFA